MPPVIDWRVSRMRIAMVTDGISPLVVGGMQGHSANLSRHLVRAGAEVIVIHPTPGPVPEAVDFFRDVPGLRLEHVPWPSRGRYPGHYVTELWKYSARVKKVLPKLESDFIYVQGLCGGALLSSKRPRKPPIAENLHGVEMFQRAADARAAAEQILLRPLASFSARRADVCISLGGTITPLLASIGVDPGRIRESPVGIDPEWIVEHPGPPNPVRKLVFVGRYERRKGVKELSLAVSRLAGSHSFEFDFIGPVLSTHRVRGEAIRYHGEIRDRAEIRRLLAGADILVCPSHAEGMPTVILEAMSQGLAIIASKVGAVEELVGENNGWLTQPGDADALYWTMRNALEISDEKLMACKRGSLERLSSRFTWPAVAEQTLRILEEASSNAPATQ